MALGPGGKTTISNHEHDLMTENIYAGALRGAVTEKNVLQVLAAAGFAILCELNGNAVSRHELPPEQAAVAIALLNLVDPSKVDSF